MRKTAASWKRGREAAGNVGKGSGCMYDVWMDGWMDVFCRWWTGMRSGAARSRSR